MLIIECNKSCMFIIENIVSDVFTWLRIRFMKISRYVVKIESVVEFVFSFSNESRQNLESILNSFDLIERSDIISFNMNDVQHDDDFDAIEFEVMIDSKVVNIAKVLQIDSNVVIQLIEMRFNSILEIVLNDVSQSIIFSIVDVSLIEYVIDVLIEKFMIRDDKIQFVFKEDFRVDIDSIVVLSEMKDLEEIIRRWWFDNDHVDK